MHLSDQRSDQQIVVTNQSSARLWPRLSHHPLDFNYNPSTMGGAVPFGVGVALAQPHREVIVLSGDGSLLMSLGCLVTAVASGITNLSILLLDNGMYEVTGGQKTAASEINLDYIGLARAAGFPSLSNFDVLEDWQSNSAAFLASAGPRFARLVVGRTPAVVFDDSALPIGERIKFFQQ
jgi:thiamine pyrophosphate-dependent acetolactate synthase large subunit-like protein